MSGYEYKDETVNNLLKIGFFGKVGFDEKIFKEFGVLYPSEEVIIKEGDITDDVFIILSGVVEVYKADGDKHVLLTFLGPGEIVGEMAFFEKTARSATIVSKTDVEVLKFSPQNFKEIFKISPYWPKKVVKSLCNRILEHLTSI